MSDHPKEAGETNSHNQRIVVRFNFDHDRTVAALMLLASANLPDLTKWKICKLFFLADKTHLVKYGRPITGDTYYALEWGPVPSDTLKALNDEHPLAIQLQQKLEKIPDHYPRFKLRESEKVDWDSLSSSDIEVLKEVVAKYGSLPNGQLSKVVHDDLAYKRAWNARLGNRALMKFESFFDEKSEILEEVLENAMIRESFAE